MRKAPPQLWFTINQEVQVTSVCLTMTMLLMIDSVNNIRLVQFKLPTINREDNNNNKLPKDKRKRNKEKENFPTTPLHSRLSSTVATHQVENPTSLSDEQDEIKFVLYN